MRRHFGLSLRAGIRRLACLHKGFLNCRRNLGRYALVLQFVTLGFGAGQAQSPAKAPVSSTWSVRLQPTKLVNGSPIVIQVKAPANLKSMAGRWLGHDVFFEFGPKANTWYGIAGVSLETHPGTYPLLLAGTTMTGEKIPFQSKVPIGRARYPIISVKVATKFTEPNPQQQQQIKQDHDVKAELFNRVTPEQEWSGRFLAPAAARISDVFGTRRVFNGHVQSMHQGLDYAVPSGTPIAALNRGTVLLARPLYFEGNCVVIDHGQGLLTMYLHLSEIKVKEGERIDRGQQIGLSGGTGRATGPHLHVAVRWQGVYLDPAILLKLPLP